MPLFLRLLPCLLWVPLIPLDFQTPSTSGNHETLYVAIVVHPENPITDFTFDDIKEILELKKQFWSDGTRVALLIRPSDSKEMEIVRNCVYHKSASELRKYWIAELYKGRIPAIPSVVKSSRSVANVVNKMPGAISVVLSTSLPPKGLRMVSIDGRNPGDRDYPLQTP
jgi:ABC-type phosphate transport system substrate-binding protein